MGSKLGSLAAWSGVIAATVRGLLAAMVAGSGLLVSMTPRVVQAEGTEAGLSVAALPTSQVIPWQPWGTVPGTPKTSPGARVAALYKDSSHLDAFLTDTSGAIMSTYWERGGWQPWFPIHPEVKAAPGTPVTAIYKDPSHLDAFTTDTSGAVISTYWEANGAWRPWFQIHPEIKAALRAPVAAVYKDASHLDAFTTDTSGAVISSYWEPTGAWRPWFQIHPETRTLPGAPVTAIYRDAAHLDAFATDTSGAVISSYWEPTGGWRPWFQIHPETKTLPGTSVAAVYKDTSHLDVFTTDTSGAIVSSYWESNGGGWRPWFQIHPETRAAPGAPITAIYRDASHLDAFATDTSGAVISSYWEPTGAWRPWFQIHPESKAAPRTPVTAVYKDPNHLDLFVVGADGQVQTSFWDTRETIQRVPVDAPTCTHFFRRWRTGVDNDALMVSCSAFMGIDDSCARHKSSPMITYAKDITGDPTGNRRALICVADPTSDSAIDQVREIAAGVAAGLADSFIAAAPYLSMVTQGFACVDGVVFACATLALDIADTAGAPLPDVVPEAVGAAKQATDCASGDVVACAQLGTRGVNAVGITIPGLDASEVADNAKKCGDDDSFIACLRLGKSATDAAGIPGGPSAIADVSDCANGKTDACTNLGRTVSKVTGFKLNDILDTADNLDKCQGTSGTDGSDACLAFGRAVANSVLKK